MLLKWILLCSGWGSGCGLVGLVILMFFCSSLVIWFMLLEVCCSLF